VVGLYAWACSHRIRLQRWRALIAFVYSVGVPTPLSLEGFPERALVVLLLTPLPLLSWSHFTPHVA